MSSSSKPAAADSTKQSQTKDLRDALLKTGLIGAGALTITWWALIACGLWHAIEWVVV